MPPTVRSIEFMVPLRTDSLTSESVVDTACPLCAQRYCFLQEHRCRRTPTIVTCCKRSVCSGCLWKLAKRCHCTPECRAVIAVCPICGDTTPVSALDMYLGSVDAC